MIIMAFRVELEMRPHLPPSFPTPILSMCTIHIPGDKGQNKRSLRLMGKDRMCFSLFPVENEEVLYIVELYFTGNNNLCLLV